MDTRCTEVLLGETTAAASVVAVIIEGIEDERSTDLAAETQVEVSANLANYERRRGKYEVLRMLLVQTKSAIEDVLADGHPKLPTRGVHASVLADLDQNIASQIAARAQYTELTLQGGITAGEEGPIS